MARILVSTELPGPGIALLRGAGHDVVVGADSAGLGRAGLLDQIAGAQAILTLVSDPVDAAALDRAPDLRVVANCAVGVDNIDLAACRRRGVVVTNTPDVLTDATADLAFALILDACRRVSEGDRLVRAGRWTGFSSTLLLGARVSGATLGIIGLGRIGRAIARRARGFAMRVVYTQRRRVDEEVERELGATWADLDTLLAESDIVSISCPLTPETTGLLSRARIARMKRGAVLVNTSRGAVIDELAVAEALASGRLFAAGLDVFAHEPRVPEALLARENAVLTPHIGSAERATREAMAQLAAESILDVLAGREPRHRVV